MAHYGNVIRAARDSGVACSVAGSGLDADPSSPFCYAVSYGYTGQPLAESGCPVSIARASIYSEFFLGLLARSRTSGQLRLPAADGRISLVPCADVELCLAPLVAWPGAMSPMWVYSGCPSKVAYVEPSKRLIVPNVPVMHFDVVGVSGANE
jgi:NAD(P)H dehydrogenase (quinone)